MRQIPTHLRCYGRLAWAPTLAKEKRVLLRRAEEKKPMLGNTRRVLFTVGLMLSLLLSATAVGNATPAVSQENTAASQENTAAGDVGVLGGCISLRCGTVVNATSRGFHVTLQWGAPWSDDVIRWVGPWSRLGGNGVDVDGIYVGWGCRMAGVINGGLYNYPFVWGSGWHKIWTNETAFVNYHVCY
jgi:hypothetical protein